MSDTKVGALGRVPIVIVLSHAQFREAIKSNDEVLSKVMAAMAARPRQDSMESNLGDV